MKYEYKIDLIQRGDKKVFYFIVPNEIRILGAFFNYDIQSPDMGKRILQYCLQVMNGKLDFKSFSSNSCSTTINSDYVKIENRYEEDNICLIETSEFKLLLEAFIKEKGQYLESIGFYK